MNIELLYIDDCPSWQEAGNRVNDALAAAGLDDTEITYRVLRTADHAAAVNFAGSPTILLDGKDLFPSNPRTSDLACRVYATPSGLAGMPTTEQLVEALVSRE
ncbi:thioredoxin family protein [Agromyces lapidis]|uniref:Thioredoxin family protein n=1 Tax=Agromyces lapidis TaxID=279574 RepID=A0ABV5SQV9_9MICO|nr:thioredoxin family protein [Agromyces lapidis]